MKSIHLNMIDRIMESPYLRRIVWISGVVFCGVVWVIGISLGIKAWELASTFFKVA